MSFNYKPFVEILPEKADTWRNYCICIACKDANDRDNTLLKKFPYKTERIQTHLKKCQHFKNKYFEIYAELFEVVTISNENNDINNPNKRLRRESTDSVFNIISQSNISTNSTKITIDPLDSFVARPLATCLLSKNEEIMFERLLIQVTVSAGFSLQWVKNKEIQELFYFLNPALKLPGRKTLGGRILDDESKILENEITQKLKDDPVRITLSFDGWTNVLNQNILGSIFITSEVMFEEIDKMGVKLIAVITDSVSSYAAARRRL
ncbi:zinc finger BED domain-containing protein 1-like [Rhizophagus clarus]|uniref:Zinc finger BED domain-containing protein 1-like n=1 Tax=Rhizophagus clarus TaxID=94130 RepID=A0A8H3LBB3_9GLOM|nr:zinc finger BED domain-containing protein 1-like [Rhizophagus clarus]